MKRTFTFQNATRVLVISVLLCAVLLTTGCSVWNPYGYSEEWPVWKKTLFFAGPGHCPLCYCVGGAIIEVVKSPQSKTTPAPAAETPQAAEAVAGQ